MTYGELSIELGFTPDDFDGFRTWADLHGSRRCGACSPHAGHNAHPLTSHDDVDEETIEMLRQFKAEQDADK
jgi:hypothetical protein